MTLEGCDQLHSTPQNRGSCLAVVILLPHPGSCYFLPQGLTSLLPELEWAALPDSSPDD